jgi:uncharacterized delta-60 repeat protein
MTNRKHNDRAGTTVFRRRMFFEPLEERRVLASIVLGSGGTGEWALDSDFAGNGKSIADVVSGSDFAWDVAVQEDGKIVAAGQAFGNEFEDFAVVRFNADGTLDATFGGDGIVTIPVGTSSDVAKAVAIDDDGKIVLAGTAFIGGNQIAVVRLNTDGSLDTTFDGDGKATTNFVSNPSVGEGLVIQNGKILVVASILEDQSVGVVRFNTDGSIDPTFGVGGKKIVDFDAGEETASFEFAADIQLDGSGQILIAAEVQINMIVDDVSTDVSRVAVARLSADGTEDITFGNGGKVVTPLAGAVAGGQVHSLAIQGDGKIVTAGTYFNDASHSDVFVLRYDSAGALDNAFDGDGLVVTNLGADERGWDVVVQGDKLVVAGSAAVSGNGDDFLLLRYTSTGALDTTFTATGRITTNFTGGDDSARGMVLDGQGRIVVAGLTANGSDQFGVARYEQSAGGPPPTFSLNENGSILLEGSYTTTSGAATISIDWGDGSPLTTLNVTGLSGPFAIPKQYFDDNPTGTAVDVNTITASIQEGTSAPASATTTATVSNVAPEVDPIGGPAAAVRGQSVTFTGSFDDVGTLDTHEVFWDFGDGTTIAFHPSTDPGALAPSHAYANAGTYTVTLIVRDDDTGETTVTRQQTIVIAQIEPAPCGCGTALVIGGTNSADNITVTAVSGGAVKVVVNSVIVGTFSPSHSIVVHAYGGNDEVQVSSSIGLSAWLYGGAGDDRLKGGSGHDVILGQEGHDLLVGSHGRDILIGGVGQDRLIGDAHDDILISGTTDHDDNEVALCHILDEWTSCRLYYVRIANLVNGCGDIFARENGSFFLNDDTVHDDGERDLLTGSSGFDWFFANLQTCGDDDSPTKDKITDKSWWEIAIDTDFIDS